MKKIITISKTEDVSMVDSIICNKCGEDIWASNTCLQKRIDGCAEQVLEVCQQWGYFSKWDLETHEFDLCQSCYTNLIKDFKVPITITEGRM